jgi:hypothetical protein
VRFGNKKVFSSTYFGKLASLGTTTLTLYIVVNSEVVGLTPGPEMIPLGEAHS